MLLVNYSLGRIVLYVNNNKTSGQVLSSWVTFCHVVVIIILICVWNEHKGVQRRVGCRSSACICSLGQLTRSAIRLGCCQRVFSNFKSTQSFPIWFWTCSLERGDVENIRPISNMDKYTGILERWDKIKPPVQTSVIYSSSFSLSCRKTETCIELKISHGLNMQFTSLHLQGNFPGPYVGHRVKWVWHLLY